MSWLLASLYDPFMRHTERVCLAAWRSELVGGLSGRVLEIGAGTGANLAHYGAGVSELVLAEPDRHMRARLARRVERGTARVPCARTTVCDGATERLPFADGAFDAVVSTLVLCSVGDLGASLGEVRRVLAPGGSFAFLEHVAADDDQACLRWQRRVEPVWTRVAGNCHLTRRTGDEIGARFAIERLERESARRAPSIVRTFIRGEARRTG